MLFRNPAHVQSFMTFLGKGVGIEGYERIGRFLLLEAMIEYEQPSEVLSVGD